MDTLNHLTVVLNEGNLEISLFLRGEFLQNLKPDAKFVRVETHDRIQEEADVAVTHHPYARRFRVDVIANPEAADPADRGHRDVKFLYY